MSKDNKNDLTFCDVEYDSQNGANLSLYHTNLSVNSQNLSLNAANLSLIRNITNRVTKLAENTKNHLFSGSEKKGCNRGDYPFLGSFLTSSNNENHRFTSHDNKRYHNPTTKHSAAKPSRQPLAIFVSKTDLINTQKVTTDTDNNVISSNRYTYGTGHSDVSYDGMSEPNKIPLWGNKFRRLNAVVVIPFIPFSKNYPTHTKHSGGYHA